jgi:hypothetical protein
MRVSELARVLLLAKVLTYSVVIIKDQVFNEKALRPDKVYGLYWVQRMGDSFKQRARTHLNGKKPPKSTDLHPSLSLNEMSL